MARATRCGAGADILSMSWNGVADAAANSALTAVQASGRNGKGCVAFASSGNNGSGYANFRLNVLTNLPTGNYFLQFEYFKDVAGTGGYDAVWIGHVRLPDADRTWLTFDSTNLPAGWSVGGNAPFTIEDDPEFAYGMGRYQARSGAIGNGQVSWIRTPAFTLVPTNMGFVSAWVDTERGVTSWNYPPVANEGDWLFVRAFNVSNATWSTFGYEAGSPGNHQNVNDSAVATNAHWPSVQTNVIGVGGITDMGYRYDGSQYRLTGLEFVAPTAGGRQGVWTTDRVSSNGYNQAAGTNGDYTAFSGTSAATPLAAGIGALLLSTDTNLTRSQVRARMRASCEKVGEVTYTAGTNLFYGYGRVNAYRALLTNDLPGAAFASNDVVRNQRGVFRGRGHRRSGRPTRSSRPGW
jgi:subtilisin family serine protease